MFKKEKKLILLLVVIGIVIYFNSFFNAFIWDDEEQIVNNVAVHSIKNLPLFFKGSTFNPGGGTTLSGLYYKPLMTTIFSLIYTLFGPHPFFFHFLQTSIHIANSILVLLILKHFLGKKSLLPFFLSLIFLVHPINTEVVVYISDLQDTGCFFLGILAFFILIKKKYSENKRILIVSSLIFLSLLFKETGIIFLAIILIYLFLYKKIKLLEQFIVSALLIIGIYSVFRFGIAGIGLEKHGLSPITNMNFSKRLISIPKIILFYLKTFLFPKDLAINQHWVVQQINFTDFYQPLIFVSLFFSILIGLGIFLWRHKNKLFKSFILFFSLFSLGLGFHCQVFPLDLTVSGRWFYFPIVGLLGIIGIAIEQIKINLPNKYKKTAKTIGFTIIILIIIGLSVRTIVRTFDWRNGLTLYSKDIKISQNSFDLENNLGTELFRAGRYDEAKKHFENSIKLAPHWWTSYNNLGVCYERQENFNKAKDYYQKAIDNGNYYLAYENLASLKLRTEGATRSADFIEKSLRKLPTNGKIMATLALSYYQMGETSKALILAERAYQITPSQFTLSVLREISNRR